jgi:DNA repair protein RecO (recombination protein O)
VDQFAEESVPDPGLFYLLRDTLGRLSEGQDLSLIARFFELHLLSQAGYQPQLFHCVRCRKLLEPEDRFLFSPMEGGVLCGSCTVPSAGRPYQGRAAPLTLPALKVLRFLQTRECETCQRVHIRPELHAELEQVMYGYLTYLLERKLKSVDFLNTLRRHKVTLGSA